jgi:hypothetical protein
MARRDQSVFSWIVEMGEARLLQFAEELLSNPKMAEAFSTALHRAARTKGQVDRNMQTLLALLGVPSKADYNKLLSKVEALQGSLVNLNIKLDRLLATRERPKRRTPAKSSDKPGTRE